MIWMILGSHRMIFIVSVMILFSTPAFAAVQSPPPEELTEVVAAFPKNFPPQYSLDEHGTPTGFAIDIMNAVARLAKLKVVYRPEESWIDAINSLQNGQADLIPNSGITPERLLDYDFTAPVETFDVVIFVRATTHDITSLNNLKGRKVAVIPLNIGKKIVSEQKDIKGVDYNEISTALFDLLAGQVDAFIYPKPVALNIARKAGIDDLIKIVGEPLVEIKRAIRVRKGDPLLARLNPVVNQFLGSVEYRKIYTKWYGMPRPYWTPKRIIFWMTGLLVLVSLAMFLWRYRSLTRLNFRLQQNINELQEVTASRDELEDEIAERKKAEEELKQSEAQYRGLFENTPVSVWQADFSEVKTYLESLRDKGIDNIETYLQQHPEVVEQCAGLVVIIDINQAALTLHRTKSKKMLLKNLAGTFNLSTLSSFSKILVAIWNNITRLEMDTVVKTLDGELRDVVVQWVVSPGYETTFSMVLISLIDISERKQLEDALYFVAQQGWALEGKVFLCSLVQYLAKTLGVDYVFVDEIKTDKTETAKTIILYALGEIQDNIEYSLRHTPCENVIGKRLCCYPQNIQQHFPLDELLVEMKAESYIGVPLWDSKGDPVGLIAAMDRKPLPQAKIQLAKSLLQIVAVRVAHELERRRFELERVRLETVIEQTTDSIIITDSYGNIQYVNPRFEQITGYSRKEVLGKNPRFLQSGEHDKAFYREMWEAISTGKVWNGHLINKKNDGSLFEENASIFPVFDNSGELIQYVAVKRDITEEIKTTQLLQQAQKMESIGTLAGGIAHDFNNILSPILGYADMVLDELPEGSLPWKRQQQVIKAGNRAKELVKQILTFGRQSEQELLMIQPEIIIKDALKFLRASLPTSIEIKKNISKCGIIHASPTHLHQIIMNLGTNAFHAMRDTGGVLSVSLDPVTIGKDDIKVIKLALTPGLYFKLVVSDTGQGMDKKTLNQIFDPYFTTKKKDEGTGLGLSVVHGIVKSYGGHISASSKLGKGTKFIIYLPRLISDDVSEKPDTFAPLQGGTEKILVVDDEEAVANMEQQMLESLGYQVTNFISSKDALEKFRSSPKSFDLIITDMAMPNMSGVQLSQKIHAIRHDIPIILCTGYSELVDKEKAISTGIQGFIMKPILKKDLATSVRELLDRRKS